MSSIAQISEAINSGTPLEEAIPKGACPAYWRQLIANYNARQANPRPKRKSTHRSHKAGKRTFRADSVVARPSFFDQQEQQHKATTTLIDRANGREPEARLIPWYINGELRTLVEVG